MRSYLLFLSLSLFVLSSCNKKESQIDNNVNPVPSTPITLKRFAVVDPAQVAPNDTIGIIRYTYDNSGRCIQINSSDYPYTGITNAYNYYNGNDTLIQKRKIVYDGTNDSTWEYFTYDVNGMMLSDSIVQLPAATNKVYNYQITGGNVVSIITSNASLFLKGVYAVNRDATGNIISESDSAFQYMPGSGYTFKNSSLVTVSYDNRNCPFYKLYPKRLVETDYENEDADDQPFNWAIMQQNNILQEVRVASPNGLSPYNHSFTYNYNTNNYPIDVSSQDNQSGEILKGYYFY